MTPDEEETFRGLARNVLRMAVARFPHLTPEHVAACLKDELIRAIGDGASVDTVTRRIYERLSS